MIIGNGFFSLDSTKNQEMLSKHAILKILHLFDCVPPSKISAACKTCDANFLTELSIKFVLDVDKKLLY